MIVVIDTGAVDRIAPIDEQRRARLRELLEQTDDIVVPAAVLAEGVFSGHPGHDHHVRELLQLLTIADVDATLGYAAGALRRDVLSGRAHPPSGVDALVVATADRYAATDDVRIITTDLPDLELLAAATIHTNRLSLLAG